MIIFHGKRTAQKIDERSPDGEEKEIDLTLRRFGLLSDSVCILEISARLVGEFSEHRAYLHYPQYCEKLVRSGQVDDRILNPDDLVNRIVPKLSFHIETCGNHVEGSIQEEISEKPKHDGSTLHELKVVIKFDNKIPDCLDWKFNDPALDDRGSNAMIYTAVRPKDLDSSRFM